MVILACYSLVTGHSKMSVVMLRYWCARVCVQIYRKTGKELCVVVTNVSSGYAEYCHVKTTPYLPIVDAVHMTLATPGTKHTIQVETQVGQVRNTRYR